MASQTAVRAENLSNPILALPRPGSGQFSSKCGNDHGGKFLGIVTGNSCEKFVDVAEAPSRSWSMEQLREAILRFYRAHNPDWMPIDWLCAAFHGHEARLDAALRRRYGAGLVMRTELPPVDLQALIG